MENKLWANNEQVISEDEAEDLYRMSVDLRFFTNWLF
jgi:hypothetical protein